MYFYVAIGILSIPIIPKILLSHINQWSTTSLSFSSFLYASSPLFLPFIFFISYCSLTLLLDDSRFALMTAPPLCPPFFPPERYCTGAAPSVPVCLSQDAVVQRHLSGWPGAGQRCWNFCLKLWSERPCCCSLCLVSHEWHTMDSDWDFADTNVYTHFHQW